jgi:hypothetical protein
MTTHLVTALPLCLRRHTVSGSLYYTAAPATAAYTMLTFRFSSFQNQKKKNAVLYNGEMFDLDASNAQSISGERVRKLSSPRRLPPTNNQRHAKMLEALRYNSGSVKDAIQSRWRLRPSPKNIPTTAVCRKAR